MICTFCCSQAKICNSLESLDSSLEKATIDSLKKLIFLEHLQLSYINASIKATIFVLKLLSLFDTSIRLHKYWSNPI